MTKKLYSLTVRGRRKEWMFQTYVDPRYIREWREDGLIIEEIVNIVPQWVENVPYGIKIWCWLQDIGIIGL